MFNKNVTLCFKELDDETLEKKIEETAVKIHVRRELDMGHLLDYDTYQYLLEEGLIVDDMDLSYFLYG